MEQTGLFKEDDIKPVEPRDKVRLGKREAQIPMRKKRREALGKLMEVLRKLEGKDLYIGTYGPSGNHFWLEYLKLSKLKVEGMGLTEDKYGAPVIVLWGDRGASIRMFTDCLVNVREQDYGKYTMWLVDFWNGFGEYPIDPHRPRGYVSLQIVAPKGKG